MELFPSGENGYVVDGREEEEGRTSLHKGGADLSPNSVSVVSVVSVNRNYDPSGLLSPGSVSLFEGIGFVHPARRKHAGQLCLSISPESDVLHLCLWRTRSDRARLLPVQGRSGAGSGACPSLVQGDKTKARKLSHTTDIMVLS